MANNQLLASDNFASGSLAVGWAVEFGLLKCQVVVGTPNVVEANVTSVQAGQIWTGLTWPSDQSSEVVATLTSEASSYLIILVRFQSDAVSGYQINISGGLMQLLRQDAGTPTVLASVGSLTFAAGDVWTVQAAGSVISVYQNQKRIGYAADPTYKTGYPGFALYSTSNISHSKILSWRGYSGRQQDGIWQKQGIAIAPITADLASSGYGAYQLSQILYEGNAQVLTGTVYKTWFTGGGTTANIYYAESLDGITWSRYASAVLASYSNAVITKFGSTYYMYAQASNAAGSGNIALFTSADGISWGSAVSTNVLAKGGAGAWDQTGFYVLCPPVVVNGTWYMLYTGSPSGSNGLFQTGLATSANGQTWAKSVSNPVILNGVPGALAQVGNTWYLWVAAGPSSPMDASAVRNYNPIEAVRYQSTDFIQWTNPVHSVHHSQIYEDVNGTSGGCAPTAIIDIGGKAYLYSLSAPMDAAAPQDYQIGLAIAPATIAKIVTAQEDAGSQLTTDNFTSGLGNLSGNWTTPTGSTKLKIVAGNLVEATATTTNCVQCYTNVAFSPDQYSELTIAAEDTNQYIYPVVRCQTDSQTWYQASIKGAINTLSAGFAISRMVNGTPTQIGPTVSATVQLGDVFRLSVVGNVLTFFQNGTLVLQVTDVLNTITSGSPGMYIYAATLANAQVSAWAGGNAGVIPTYTSNTSNNLLFATNTLQTSNGLIVTNSLFANNSLGGTEDWS